MSQSERKIMSEKYQVKPFKIAIPEADLQEMMEKLRHTRFPPDFGNDDWRYGYNTSYHRTLVDYWINQYDWRKIENEMNQLPQFKVDVMGVPLHFIHVKGSGKNPMPLLLHHGWPWTFWDVRKVIEPFTNPEKFGGSAEDSFDVVLISLPGYGFSSPLTQTGWNWWQTADLENVLMKEILGYEKYATAGGDWGALIAQQHGHKYESDVIGVYSHFAAQMSHYLPTHPDQPEGIEFDPILGLPAAKNYTESEAGWFERGKLFVERESGYGGIQLTKPQTLAALVADSPAAQLAWITEKRYFWGLAERGVGTEAFEEVWPKDDLITTAAVYYLTNTGGTSSRYYWECLGNPWKPTHSNFPVIGAPSAVSIFPGEIYKPPLKWTEKYFNLKQYRVHDRGGHFAPLEVPDIYVDDVRTFFRQYR
jgi:pimeloyl-ACP methyl ester carboxylesterase